MIVVRHKGDFKKTEKFLNAMTKKKYFQRIEKYAQQGVDALASATPVNTGKTASSWDYEIKQSKNGLEIYWTNSNVNQGVPIAILIQYDHRTGTGGFVQGIDYINPALRPIFEKIAEDVWKEVTSS